MASALSGIFASVSSGATLSARLSRPAASRCAGRRRSASTRCSRSAASISAPAAASSASYDGDTDTGSNGNGLEITMSSDERTLNRIMFTSTAPVAISCTSDAAVQVATTTSSFFHHNFCSVSFERTNGPRQQQPQYHQQQQPRLRLQVLKSKLNM